MPEEPLVSAVITAYNHEAYIAQAIDSALAQETDYEYEIVIGEDCSTDRTRQIVCDYQHRYPQVIRVVTAERNVGLLANFDRTVRAARGKYIACCSGDDYWHNRTKIAKQTAFLEGNPEYGMIHGDVDHLHEPDGFVVRNADSHRPQPPVSDGDIRSLLMGRCPVNAGTAMFRKSLFSTYYDLRELREHQFLMEDTPLWLEIGAHAKLRYLPESLLTHREMAGTISNPHSFEDKVRFIESSRACLRHYCLKYRDLVPDQEAVLESIDSRVELALLSAAFEARRSGDLRASYRKLRSGAGRRYLTSKKRVMYYVTFIPRGMSLYSGLRRAKRRLRKMATQERI